MTLIALATLAFGIFLLSNEGVLKTLPSIKAKLKYPNALAYVLIGVGLVGLIALNPDISNESGPAAYTLPPTAAQLIVAATKVIQLYVF